MKPCVYSVPTVVRKIHASYVEIGGDGKDFELVPEGRDCPQFCNQRTSEGTVRVNKHCEARGSWKQLVQ
jgi:hypothetical protein